jgi:hypothetical protein
LGTRRATRVLDLRRVVGVDCGQRDIGRTGREIAELIKPDDVA